MNGGDNRFVGSRAEFVDAARTVEMAPSFFGAIAMRASRPPYVRAGGKARPSAFMMIDVIVIRVRVIDGLNKALNQCMVHGVQFVGTVQSQNPVDASSRESRTVSSLI